MKKQLITALFLVFIATSCNNSKNADNMENQIDVQTENAEEPSYKVDLLASEVQVQMKRFAQILEEEIFTLKVEKDKLDGQSQIDLENSIRELQREKDIFNKKLGQLDPYSGGDQSRLLVELDSITDIIQSKIKEIRTKFPNR